MTPGSRRVPDISAYQILSLSVCPNILRTNGILSMLDGTAYALKKSNVMVADTEACKRSN